MVRTSSAAVRENIRSAASGLLKRDLQAAFDALVMAPDLRRRPSIDGIYEDVLARALDGHSEQFSLRLLSSGYYQLIIRSKCDVVTGRPDTRESGFVSIVVRGDTVQPPEYAEVTVRTPSMFGTISITNDKLERFYGELRNSDGSTFIVNVADGSWQCVVKDSPDNSFRLVSDRFAVSTSLVSQAYPAKRWDLRGSRAWGSENTTQVAETRSPSVAILARTPFRAKIECSDSQFNLSASICVNAARIEAAEFLPEWDR